MTGQPAIDCEDVLRHMFAYIDGELTADRQQAIDAHLEACRSCFSRAEFERLLKEHLRDLQPTGVPGEFEERIRSLTKQLRSR